MGAAAATAAVGLAGCAPAATDEAPGKDEGEGLAFTGEDEFADCQLVYGCCSPECQHHLLKGYVRDGKLVKVESGEVNREPRLRPRLRRVEMCNSDKRLTKPLKLVGEKGSGDFEEITWDRGVRSHSGEAAVRTGQWRSQVHHVPGRFGQLQRPDRCVLHICRLARRWHVHVRQYVLRRIDSGLAPVLGQRMQLVRNEIANSNYIIAWGNNPVISMTGYFGRFQEMMDNGGTLCTIDPFLSETADKSQEWIQPWPAPTRLWRSPC